MTDYNGGPILCLLLVAVGFAMLPGVYCFGLIVCNRQNALFTMAAGTVLNVVLNLMLILGYSLVGGAFSALVSEGLIFVLALSAIARSATLSPWKPLA